MRLPGIRFEPYTQKLKLENHGNSKKALSYCHMKIYI